jgi:hypothetical protein
MVDVETRKPVRVSDGGPAGPYIRISVGFLEKVRSVLLQNSIEHWVDHIAISVDGDPEVTVIYVGKRFDASRIQELLDSAS